MKGLGIVYLCIALAYGWKTYDSYKVYTVTAHGKGQLDTLVSYCEEENLDVWKMVRYLGDSLTIMVSPEQDKAFRRMAFQNQLSYSVLFENVGSLIAEEKQSIDARRKPDGRLDFDIEDFNTYDDIMNQLEVWQGRCPDALTCTVATLGNSHEGNPIDSFTISSGSGRPQIWIDSLIHAREWMSGSVVLYFIENIISNYGTDSDIQGLLDTYDWVFVPVMNPDGYIYSWTNERLWRKNREPDTDSGCNGTDLNRNYDTGAWGWSGTSTNPCSDTYGGPSAGSAPETQIIQNEIDSRSGNTVAFVSIHSAAAMWLHPWGHATVPDGNNCAMSEAEADMLRVGEATIDAIESIDDRPNNNQWVAGSICTTIYPASGGTIDYAHNVGMKYPFTPELSGNSGFTPPASDIEPTFREMWSGIVAMIGEIEAIEG